MSLAIAKSMPANRDTSILRINNALTTQGLILNQVNGRYIKKHGAPYNLLQERKCRLIIGIKLTSLDGRPMYHFVGWDGAVIYDKPFANKVSDFRDRSSAQLSNLVFAKL